MMGVKFSSEVKLLRLYKSFLWEENKCERVMAFGKVKEADDIHLTDQTVVFFVCGVYMMVAVVRVSSRVVFG